MPFRYEGISFTALTASGKGSEVGRNFAQRPQFKGNRRYGHLLVLTLDASLSMDETDTYDGRPKHVHVNEILKESLRGLQKAGIASSLWVSVLAFSDEVVEHTGDRYDAVFSVLADWAETRIDYLDGIDRGLTNIRLALDYSADLIDGFRHSDVSEELAQRWETATVVLLTDGRHETQVNGRNEGPEDIDDHVDATINRSENVSFGFIGLGESACQESMHTWATKASEVQKQMAARKNVPLVGESLYVQLNAKNDHLHEIIRSVIDVVSSRGATA